MSAKSQRIAQAAVYLLFDGAICDVIQIAFFIRYTVAYRGMQVIILNGFHAGDEFHAAGRSQQMAYHRFGGADFYP